MSNPIGGNQYYKTVRAYTPNVLPRSGIVDETTQDLFTSTDVNVDISGTSSGDLVIIGDPITPGSVITDAGMNAGNSVTDSALQARIGTAIAAVSPADPNTPTIFVSGAIAATTCGTGVPGTDINGGIALGGQSVTVTQPAGPSPDSERPVWPVLFVITGPVAGTTGSINTKLRVFNP